jgi:DNA-directed RNA polymerase subunit K/omega
MTKYEFTRLICARVQQMSEGAPTTLTAEDLRVGDGGGGGDDQDLTTKKPLELAVMELEAGKLPMMVQRTLPDGSTEVWKSRELEPPMRLLEHVKTLVDLGTDMPMIE